MTICHLFSKLLWISNSLTLLISFEFSVVFLLLFLGLLFKFELFLFSLYSFCKESLLIIDRGVVTICQNSLRLTCDHWLIHIRTCTLNLQVLLHLLLFLLNSLAIVIEFIYSRLILILFVGRITLDALTVHCPGHHRIRCCWVKITFVCLYNRLFRSAIHHFTENIIFAGIKSSLTLFIFKDLTGVILIIVLIKII